MRLPILLSASLLTLSMGHLAAADSSSRTSTDNSRRSSIADRAAAAAAAATPPAPVVTGTKARIAPQAKYASRLVGGRFQGSNDGTAWVDLGGISSAPRDGVMSEYALSSVDFRYLRYLGPIDSYCMLSELEFCDATGVMIGGVGMGTPGSFQESGDSFDHAFDGDLKSSFAAPTPHGAWVGIDRKAAQARVAPRAGKASLMVGGHFQGSADGTSWVEIGRVTYAPREGALTAYAVSAVDFPYLRYLSPAGGYCTIAELEFRTASDVKLAGTAIGDVTTGANNLADIAAINPRDMEDFNDSWQAYYDGLGRGDEWSAYWEGMDDDEQEEASEWWQDEDKEEWASYMKEHADGDGGYLAEKTGKSSQENQSTRNASRRGNANQQPAAAAPATPAERFALAFDANVATYFNTASRAGGWIGIDRSVQFGQDQAVATAAAATKAVADTKAEADAIASLPAKKDLVINGLLRAADIRAGHLLITESWWADYVFSPDYRLMPLAQVKAFVQEHQHLPGVPAAEAIIRDGVQVNDMLATHMGKIEELTLHVIHHEETMLGQSATIRQQDETIRNLVLRIQAIERANSAAAGE